MASASTDERSAATYGAFAGMCLIWGSTFLAIRIGNESLPPLWAASLRLAIAAPLYLAIAGGTARGIRGPASLVVLVAAASGGGLVFALAGPIVLALGGGELPGAVAVLRVLCLLPFLTGLTAILGANTLLAEGRGDVYAASQIAVALLGLPLAALAIMHGGAVGAAWAAVVTEAGLALGYGLALRRAGLMARVLR